MLSRKNKWLLIIAALAALSAICSAQLRPSNSAFKIITLPPPKLTGPASLEQVLAKRRSGREFSGKALDYEQIGQLAWAGQGITEPSTGRRTAPSAGEIYPITLYIATPEGFFAYNPEQHALEQFSSSDLRGKISAVAAQQKAIAAAPCDIIIAGAIKKLAPKFSNKSRRFMMIEAGHVAQNILLQAVSLNLVAVPLGGYETPNVAAACNLPEGLEPVYIVAVGYPAQSQLVPEIAEPNGQKETSQMDKPKTKKALLIVPSENFRDEELFNTQSALSKTNIETVLASSKTGPLRGMLGGKADATILIKDVFVNDYVAVVFIGGSGAKEYFNNQAAMNIAREAKDKEKLLAAICIAPTILANAGLLNGVKTTSFPSEQASLQKAGAIYTGADVEKDGLIITGSGPKASEKFGKAVADAIAAQ
jgi:protease I